MNGFVSNLISRHTQADGNVKPRVRGRFEPERTLPAPALEGFSGPVDSFPPEQITQEAEDASLSATARPTLFRSEAPPATASPATTPFSEDTATSSSSVTDQQGRIPLLGENEAGPQRHFSPLKLEQQGLEKVKPAPPKRHAADALPIAPFPEKVIPASHPNATPDTWESDSATDWAGNLTRLQGLLGDAVRLPDSRANGSLNAVDQPLDLQPQPVIKVTIGRIEVRAIALPTSAKVQPQAGPKPLLSLEDYLKQRTTRTRRE